MPAGTEVQYVFGSVAPQGRQPGGGVQYLFPDGLDPGDAPETCASTRVAAAKARYTVAC